MTLIYWLDEAPIGEPRLAADEQGRLGRISHPRRRRRFLRGRALLQHALTENFGEPLAYAGPLP